MTAPSHSLVRAAFAGLLATAGLSLATAPSAQAAPVFAIAPATPNVNGYFVLQAKPGSVLKRQVKVTNVGNRTGIVRVYPVDATTGRTTGAVYLGADRPRRDVGAWIDLPQRRARLAPGASKVVAFAVRVPSRARGGQHLGGIVANNVSVRSDKGGKKAEGSFKVDVRHLTITAVQVELPGAAAPRMSIDGLGADGRPGYQNVLVDMANPGNRMIKPQLDLRVEDDDGKRVLSRTTKLDTFLPDTRIEYPVPVLGRGLGAGTYEGTVAIRLGGKVLDRFSGSFEVTEKQVTQVFGEKAGPTALSGGSPWKTILACILGAALAVALLLGTRAVLARRAEAAARAAELAQRARQEEERRLAGLESRESRVSEREHALAQQTLQLEAAEHELLARETKHSERDRELGVLAEALDARERTVARTAKEDEQRREERATKDTERRSQLEQVLTLREHASEQRERSLAESELRLQEREAQEATRRDKLDQSERRMREREEQHEARRLAHETEQANRSRTLDEDELRLRQREDESLQARRQRDERDAAAHLSLQEGKRRLLEDEQALRQRSAAKAAALKGTLAGRLRRRVGKRLSDYRT